jgi:hypothetical protein
MSRVALIDDADFNFVNEYKWRIWERQHPGLRTNGPYARTSIWRGGRATTIFMHTLITGWPRTDHINHNGLDNCRSNLRPATNAQNGYNRRPSLSAKSPYRGVGWNREARKWQAAIWLHGTCRYLGLFSSPESAARAYDAAARQNWGDYAYLNFRGPVMPAYCPRCPDGTELEDDGQDFWCPAEQERIPDAEVAEAT